MLNWLQNVGLKVCMNDIYIDLRKKMWQTYASLREVSEQSSSGGGPLLQLYTLVVTDSDDCPWSSGLTTKLSNSVAVVVRGLLPFEIKFVI